MARELTVVVRVEDGEAVRKLDAIDRKTDDLSSGFDRAGKQASGYVIAQDKLSSSTGLLEKTTSTLTDATAKQTKAYEFLHSGVAATIFKLDQAAVATVAVESAEVAATTATTGFAASITALGGVVNLLVPALAVFTAAYTAVRGLGELYSDYREKLDKAALSAETLAAKQDTINRAIERGALSTIQYTEAVEFLTKAEERRRSQIPEEAAQRYLKTLTLSMRASMDEAAALNATKEGLAKLGIAYEDLDKRIEAHRLRLGLPDAVEAAVKREADALRKAEQIRAQVERARTGPRPEDFGFGPDWEVVTKRIRTVGEAVEGLSGRGDELDKMWQGLNADGTLSATVYENVAGKLQHVGRVAGITQQEIEKLRASQIGIREIFSTMLADLPKVIVASIGAGGNPLKAAGSLIGSSIGEMASSGLNEALKGAKGLLGTLGKAVSSALPAIGALLGPIASLIGNKLFHVEERRVNDLRDAFQSLNFGSLDQMNVAFQRVGLTVDRVLNAKKVKDFEAAVNEFNARVQFQQDSWRKAEDAAKRYGLTLAELGPAWQKNRLDEQAKQLFEDFQLLVGAGADQVAVTTRMSGALNDYLHKAMTLGIEVPSALKPIIEQMIQLGLLTDASGKKVGSLEESGIKFSETMSEGFQKVVDAITRMTDAIRLFLGLTTQAADAASRLGGGGSPGYEAPPDYAQTFHQGGVVVPFVPRAHNGLFVGRLRRDEVPIVAQSGEGIVSRRGMAVIGGKEGLDTINAGPPSPWIKRGRPKPNEEWIKATPDHPWMTMGGRGAPVIVDARGAYFNQQTAKELTRMVAERIANGPDQTRMRGSLRVGR